MGMCIAAGDEDSGTVFESYMVVRTSQEVVFPLVEDAGRCVSYSWRRVLPAMPLHLGFGAAARHSLSEWQDPSLAFKNGEAPITLKYAGGARKELSRLTKTLLKM
eukprot:8736667-Karenia_brevis.AAC.1